LKPHALPEYLEGRTPKKNVLSFLEEIGRAHIRKSEENFFAHYLNLLEPILAKIRKRN